MRPREPSRSTATHSSVTSKPFTAPPPKCCAPASLDSLQEVGGLPAPAGVLRPRKLRKVASRRERGLGSLNRRRPALARGAGEGTWTGPGLAPTASLPLPDRPVPPLRGAWTAQPWPCPDLPWLPTASGPFPGRSAPRAAQKASLSEAGEQAEKKELMASSETQLDPLGEREPQDPRILRIQEGTRRAHSASRGRMPLANQTRLKELSRRAPTSGR